MLESGICDGFRIGAVGFYGLSDWFEGSRFGVIVGLEPGHEVL